MDLICSILIMDLIEFKYGGFLPPYLKMMVNGKQIKVVEFFTEVYRSFYHGCTT